LVTSPLSLTGSPHPVTVLLASGLPLQFSKKLFDFKILGLAITILYVSNFGAKLVLVFGIIYLTTCH
jgi:hypothetical protein